MASFVFFIVTTFQIWACHMTCVYKLAKNFISRDTLLNFRKSHQICMSLIPALVRELLKKTKSPPGWNRVKVPFYSLFHKFWQSSSQ